jgi:probable rRNA maturation factor
VLDVSVQVEDGIHVEQDVIARIVRAVEQTLRAGAAHDAEVSVTLLGDGAIAALNQRWLGLGTATDVLAFPLFAAGEPAVGDVYIGAEQAVRQAAQHDVTLVEELVRLAIHGTLHVLGHDHVEGEERVKGTMWQLQERLVAEVMAQ